MLEVGIWIFSCEVQIPNEPRHARGCLDLEAWCFSGCWKLEFGSFHARSKFQTNLGTREAVWILKLGASLDVGSWKLDFFMRGPNSKRSSARERQSGS